MVTFLVSEADSEAVLAVSLAASLKASATLPADIETASAVSMAASPATLVASPKDLEAVSAVLLVASLAVSLASLGVLGSSPVKLHYIPSKATEVMTLSNATEVMMMVMTFGRPVIGGRRGTGGRAELCIFDHSVIPSASFKRVHGMPFEMENIPSKQWRTVTSLVDNI